MNDPRPSDAAANVWTQGLAAAQEGNPDALGQMLDACRAYLLEIANAELGPRLRAKAGASDLVQESLLEAQRDFAQFAGTSADEWRAWLRRILLHNVANLGRRYRSTGKRQVGREVSLDTPSGEGAPREPADDASSPSGAAMRREQERLLEQALARLPEHYRQVIVWRNHERRSFAEIGRLLDRSADAARMLWGRALEQLQHLLGSPP